MIVEQLSLNDNLLDLGCLLGTAGRQELISSINQQCGGASFFGSEMDPYRSSYATFMNTIVRPLKDARMGLNGIKNTLTNVDAFRSIDSVEKLEQGIPACMRVPILLYKPMRKMLEEDRIDGFGIKASDLPDEDMYGRMIANGTIDIHSTNIDKEGKFTLESTYVTTDPVVTSDELDNIEDTRTFIDKFLESEDTRHCDFTDYPSLHS